MLCVTLSSYSRTCGGVSGGISDIAQFDPADFDFTQATVSGVVGPYSAVARMSGATAIGGAKFFPVSFQVDEAEWTWKQSRKGCSVKYEHEFKFQLPENSQTLTNFLQMMDAAACCCGLGMVIRLNSGKIFVAGEKYVNASSVPRFTITQDGSEGGSGKVFDDFNGGNIALKGAYSRNLYEFTGGWPAIEALM